MLSFLMGVFCRVELTRSLGNLIFWIVFQSSCTISHSHWQYMIVLISPHLHQHLLLSFIKAMAPHSSTLAWRIPWMEEPGGLQSMGSLRVRHADQLPFHFSHSLEKEMATHSSVLAWRIPGTGDPGRWPSVGSHRVGHD